MVTLVARSRCYLCGYMQKVVRISAVRVGRRSLRETGVSIVAAGLHRFPECGERNLGDMIPVSRYRLHPDDERAVREYRERKWPG